MGHGKTLSQRQHWFIVGGGVSLQEARSVPYGVRNAGKAERVRKADSGRGRRAGRQLALTERELRQLVRAAATGESSRPSSASLMTIQRVLQLVDHLVYSKMDRTLPLMATQDYPHAMGGQVHTESSTKMFDYETKQFLQEMQLNSMAWPAGSPGGNLIENVWSAMAAKVYAHSRQYQSVAELEAAIMAVSDSIPARLLAEADSVHASRGGETTSYLTWTYCW
ncbi:hypothetical protein DVH05_010587 [Phytophthora capsici]|nr:hypothetical protein DVH05_010587 [Phytophthora capsici]